MNDNATRLQHEILEQPVLLRQLLEAFPESFDNLSFPGFFTQKLIGIGEGSSFNALKIAAPFVEEFCGLNMFTFEPEALQNKVEIASSVHQSVKRLFNHSYFITVSQSGRTASTLHILEALQMALGFSNQYAPLLAFTNNLEGTMAQRYGNHFELKAGSEKSIAATKSMTQSIMSLLLFGLKFGQKRGWLKRTIYQTVLNELQQIPDQMAALDKAAFHQQLKTLADHMSSSNQFVMLSKGVLSTVLPEIGLKLTETSSNIVWTDNTESFKHGRKVILKGVKGVRPMCIYVVPPALTPSEADVFFQDMRSHFFADTTPIFSMENLFFTVFENSPPIPEAIKAEFHLTSENVLTLPATHGIASLFVTLMTFQLLSCYLADAKGEDPNNRALQKAITQ